MSTEEKTEANDNSNQKEEVKEVVHVGHGVTSKIRERLEKAKESTKTKVREEAHEIKEKVNPMSETNKFERKKKGDRKKYLRQVERNAEREAEIESAKEAGQRKAEQKYAPTSQVKRRSAGGSLESSLFGPAPKGFGTGYYDMNMFGGATAKPKAAPVRTTTVNLRTGKTTITEPIEPQKKKSSPMQHNSWDLLGGSADSLSLPQLGTRHTAAYDFPTMKRNKATRIVKPNLNMQNMFSVPKGMRPQKKKKRSRGIGDLF